MTTRQQADPLALGIGSVLADLRRQRGLSGVQLADLSGITQSQISRWEHGQREISVADLYTMCEALGVNPWDFMAEAKRRAATFVGGLTTAVLESKSPPSRPE